MIPLLNVALALLVGPLMTRQALKAAGEISKKPKEIVERRARALAAAPQKELASKREAIRRRRS